MRHHVIVRELTAFLRSASARDRAYLEQLNLKQLQKGKTPEGDPKEYYQGLQEQAKSGPVFTDKALSLVDGLPDLPKPFTKWLGNLAATGGVDNIDPAELNRITKWVTNSPSASRRVQKMSWDEAVDASVDWSLHGDAEATTKWQNSKVVHQFQDGWKIVELETKADIKREGILVQNCLRDPAHDWFDKVDSGQTKLYSLRTPTDDPRADIEVTGGEVKQCYGKQNKLPLDKYNPYLIEFFDNMRLYDGYSVLQLDIPDDKIRHMLGGSNIARNAVARNSNTSPTILAILAKDKDESIRVSVAVNRSTSVDTLSLLADDSSDYVRQMVARNAKTLTLLTLMAKDKDKWVRVVVAENDNTSPSVLALLATDSDENVRVAVAQSTSTLPDTLALLAMDKSVQVREYVAENVNTPSSALKLLAGDDEESVRDSVVYNKNAPDDVRDQARNYDG